MKKAMLLLALMGFTTIGSYAQVSKPCACKKKVYKVAVVHHKACPTGYVAVHKSETHKTVYVAKRPVNVNYRKESSYTGNYTKCAPVPDRESRAVYMHPTAVPVATGPSTDPDYYINMPADGNCRWHCSLPY
jgi:hypothetical protein